jgi:hypothetical protein
MTTTDSSLYAPPVSETREEIKIVITVTRRLNAGSVQSEKHRRRRPLLDNGSLTSVSAAMDRLEEDVHY